MMQGCSILRRDRRRDPSRLARLSAAAVLALCAAGLLGPAPAGAQQMGTGQGTTNLGSIAGQSRFQSGVGDVVQMTCGGLSSIPNRAPDPDDLFMRCRELVRNGNEVNMNGMATGFSLGLSTDDLNDALLDVAHEESAAQGTSSTETATAQVGNVVARLGQRRGGLASRGFDMDGFSFAQNGVVLPGKAIAALGQAVAQNVDLDSDLFSRLGFFVNGQAAFGDRDSSDEEAGFDFNSYGITAGVDYLVTDSFVAGLAIGFANTHDEFNGSKSDLDQDAYSITVYGTYFHQLGFYIDGVVTFAYNEFDLKRDISYGNAGEINRTAKGDTDSFEYTISVGGGYDFYFDNITVGPYGRINYVHSDIDGFTETGAQGLNLRYEDQDSIESVMTELGVQASMAISTEAGILTPYARAEWEHEFDDDSRKIRVQYDADPNNNGFFVQTDDPDRNTLTVGGGISWLMPGGTALFLDAETLLLHDELNEYVLTIGGRFEF